MRFASNAHLRGCSRPHDAARRVVGWPTVLGTPEERRKGSPWARKYPPLLAMALAVLIAVAVLPSALNLPQANPTETLEYAPVPPSDDDPPPPPAAGNLASLGLASSPGHRLRARPTPAWARAAPAPAPGRPRRPTSRPRRPPSCRRPSRRRRRSAASASRPARRRTRWPRPAWPASPATTSAPPTRACRKDEVAVLFYFDGFINDIGTSRGQERAPRTASTSTCSTRRRTTSTSSSGCCGAGSATSTTGSRPTTGSCTSTPTTPPRRRRRPAGPTPPTPTPRSSRSPRSATPGRTPTTTSTAWPSGAS